MKKTETKPRTKRTTKKKQEDLVIEDDSMIMEDLEPDMGQPKTFPRMVGVVIVLCLLAGLLAYRYRYFAVPATVNGRPVFVWEYLSTLHKQYGAEVLNTITTESLIEQEITRTGTTVPAEEIQSEVDAIDKRASASGGLKAILDAQGMTEQQLRKQIQIQLAVKQILADKIAVTDQEVNDSYTKNKDFFKGVAEAEAKAQIKEQLESQKFQQQAGVWLNELKSKSSIQINVPGFASQML